MREDEISLVTAKGETVLVLLWKIASFLKIFHTFLTFSENSFTLVEEKTNKGSIQNVCMFLKHFPSSMGVGQNCDNVWQSGPATSILQCTMLIQSYIYNY